MAITRIKRTPGAVVAIALAISFLTSTGGTAVAATQDKPVKGGTLNFVMQTDLRTMDPMLIGSVTGSSAFHPYYFVYSALVYQVGDGSSVEPLLASSLQTPDKGTTWVLKLRPDIKFSDGTLLDANAVKFNWDRIKNPANASPQASVFATVASYTITDPLTLSLVLTSPNSQFDAVLAGSGLSYIGSPTAIQQLGADFGNKPVGAGAFLLKEWIRGDHATFTRNTAYFEAKKVYLDQIVTRPIPDSTGKQNAFATGTANLVWTSQPADANAMKQSGGVVTTYPTLGNIGILWNMRKAPFTDPSIPRAFNQAMDRDLLGTAYAGVPTKLPKGLLPPTSPFYDAKAKYPKTDLAAAQKAVDAYTVKNGPLNLQLVAVAANPQNANIAQAVKQQLEQLKGVSVTISQIDQSNYTATLRTGAFDIAFSGLVTTVGPEPGFYNALHSKGSFNIGGYSNAKVDAAIEHSRTVVDAKVRQTDYDLVQEEVTKDGYLPPYNNSGVYLVAAKNVHVEAFATGIPRADLIWIGKSKK